MGQRVMIVIFGWWVWLSVVACSFTTVPSSAQGTPIGQPTAPPVVLAADAGQIARSTAGGLPVFPAALPLEASSPLARLVGEMSQQASQQQPDLQLTLDSYALPASIPFAAVREFYDAELVAAGWHTATDQHDMRFPGMQTNGFAAWTHTNRAFVTVTQLSNPQQTGHVVLIIQHGRPR